MCRYIDADALMQKIDEGNKSLLTSALAMTVIKMIDDIPTADVVERRSGHWMWDALGIHCSSCMYKLQTTGLPSFCPNCGAKMEVK